MKLIFVSKLLNLLFQKFHPSRRKTVPIAKERRHAEEIEANARNDHFPATRSRFEKIRGNGARRDGRRSIP